MPKLLELCSILLYYCAMTHLTGAGCSPPSGRQLISTRFYPEPIIITDDEVHADEAEREAEAPNREADGRQPEW